MFTLFWDYFPVFKNLLVGFVISEYFYQFDAFNDMNFGRAESLTFHFQSEIFLTAFLSFSCLPKICDRLKQLNLFSIRLNNLCSFLALCTACMIEPYMDKLWCKIQNCLSYNLKLIVYEYLFFRYFVRQ